MTQPHLPERPTWRCKVDGDEWPCTRAMINLENEFADAKVSLCLYLVDKWFDAVADMPSASDELYRRIVGWPRY